MRWEAYYVKSEMRVVTYEKQKLRSLNYVGVIVYEFCPRFKFCISEQQK